MTANRISLIGKNLDAKRTQRYMADNRALWNLEYEAEKAIKLCEDIKKEWMPKKIKVRFFSE